MLLVELVVFLTNYHTIKELTTELKTRRKELLLAYNGSSTLPAVTKVEKWSKLTPYCIDLLRAQGARASGYEVSVAIEDKLSEEGEHVQEAIWVVSPMGARAGSIARAFRLAHGLARDSAVYPTLPLLPPLPTLLPDWTSMPCEHNLAVRQFLQVKGTTLDFELTHFAVAWRKSSAKDKFNARRDQTFDFTGFTSAAPSMTLTRDDRILLMTGEARTVIAACAGDEGLTAELRGALKGIFDKAVDKAGAAGHVTPNPTKKRARNKAATAAAEGGEAHAANPQVPPSKSGRKRQRRIPNVGQTPVGGRVDSVATAVSPPVAPLLSALRTASAYC
ncbi:hypothetical protein T492DRAFT_1142300 [Pavlovales sp. CCMP2436]|nr:hypothetical protein T492DRAFT_1142300 [Pavlovales sp. CCMP2436]